MKFGNQSGAMLVWLNIIIFTLSVTCITHAALLDKETIEVLYLFDEGEGEVAVDSSLNGRDGAILGAQYAEGIFGTCLLYDGQDDNLIVTGYTGVGGVDPRTTLFWFKANGTRDHSWVKWGPNTSGAKYYIRAHVIRTGMFLEN